MAVLVLVVMIALAARYVWPTPYRYFPTSTGSVIRIDRFSNRAWILQDDGWMPVGLAGRGAANPFADLAGEARAAGPPPPPSAP